MKLVQKNVIFLLMTILVEVLIMLINDDNLALNNYNLIFEQSNY